MNEILDIDDANNIVFHKNYASFLRRLAAAIIDAVIVYIPLSLVFYFIKSSSLSVITSYVVPQVYEAYYLSTQKATIGKKVMNLQVISLDGQTITFANGLGRAYGKFVSAFILLIGYFMVLWDDKKQSLHDKMASTIVVKV